MRIEEIIGHFILPGTVRSVSSFGNGHINDTYRIETDRGSEYLLQRVNTVVFRKPEEVQDNICRVTAYLRDRICEEGGDPLRETLTPVLTGEATSFVMDETGYLWRIYLFVPGTRSCEQPVSADDLYEAGRAFGVFERRLRDFPAETLYETIPGFHDTPARALQLREAMKKDAVHRGERVKAEYQFCTERMQNADLFRKAHGDGLIQKRVTHNDTKANNALLDAETGRGICVCDLDTVMPGFAAYDFGDAVRYGASLAQEDEQDLTKVTLSVERAKAYAEGFLSEAGMVFSETERKMLPDGIWMITYEQAMRFLTDYLNGDVYYKTEYPDHNLVRARNQMALVCEIERCRSSLMRLV
ncbi:MAG: aminoglycoside phosphotransferase family protein [Clostridia bacterium]|nr:aminoglycoside phosphotransferase family protein [Clostridia bacterium]